MNSTNTALLEKSGFGSAFQKNQLRKFFKVVETHLHRGQLTINLPSGQSHEISCLHAPKDKNHCQATWNLRSYRTISRTLRTRSVGFAESYMEGEWDSPDLTGLLELMACNMDAIEAYLGNWNIVRAWNRIQHLLRTNTRRGSKRNIAYHYDLGNDFYAGWLDKSMTYSSGLFDAQHTDLESAQHNKYKQIAERLTLAPGQEVLEIGAGWGGFAEFAARNYGCRITGITLSEEQLKYSRARIADAGLSDLVEFRLQDYRDVDQQFDRIVSIEMFEAVGEEHWATYFEKLNECLRPGGYAGIQVISIANERYASYRNDADFIQKYIFPGGMLPSPDILRSLSDESGLSRIGEETFGLSYAETLKTWRTGFLNNWESIAELGYSEKFKRMWEYYLCYCEAGFRRGTIDVGHYFLQKPVC